MNPRTSDDRTPVVSLMAVRVKVRVDDEETFVARYQRFVKDDRIFIVTRKPQAIGTLLRFVLSLKNGKPVLKGTGEVLRVRTEDDGDATRPPGMVLRFATLDEDSQRILEMMRVARNRKAPRPAPPPQPVPFEPMRRDDTTGTFMILQDQPRFGERWDDTLPANPFHSVADDELDYFVEWSVEAAQMTSAPALVAVPAPAAIRQVPAPAPVEPAAPERAAPVERTARTPPLPPRRQSWRTMGIGLALGVPVGAFAMWMLRVPAAATPALVAPPVAAVVALPPAAVAAAPPAALIAAPVKPVAAVPVKAVVAAPARAAAVAPTWVPLAIRAQPADAHVTVDGKAVGRAPVTVHVRPGAHEVTLTKSHYAHLVEHVAAPGDVELKMSHR